MGSFLSLLDSTSAQLAQQQVPVRQQRENLAVMPRADLSGVARDARQRFRVLEAIRLGDRRLDLQEDELRSQRKQLPFAIGLGALDLGVNIAEGVRNLRSFRDQQNQALRLESLQNQQLEEQRRFTDALDEMRAQQRRSILAPASSRFLQPGR